MPLSPFPSEEYKAFAKMSFALPHCLFPANGITLNNGLEYKRREDFENFGSVCCVKDCEEPQTPSATRTYDFFGTPREYDHQSGYCVEHERFVQRNADKDASSSLSTDGNPTTLSVTGGF